MDKEQEIVYFQKLDEAYILIKYLKYKYSYLFEDLKQEVALYLLEHQDYENIKESVRLAVRHFFTEERKYKRFFVFTKPTGKDGQEIDESYYLVDPATLPQYGVRKSPVTELMRMKVSDICKSKVLIAQILNRKFNNKYKGL